MAYSIVAKVFGDIVRYEALAAGTIKPGHLVKLGSAGTLTANATAGVKCEMAVAVEDALQGNDIADSYSSADLVQYNIFRPGDCCYLRLKNGENVAVGDKLVAAAGGEVAEFKADSSATVVEQVPIAIAMEAVDMSDSSAADPSGLIKVRVL